MSEKSFKTITRQLNEGLAAFRAELPEARAAFSSLHHATMQGGALDALTKELIALAIGVAARCDGCIGFHTQALVKLGVTKAQLAEMLGVAVMMGGGPSLMYAGETMRAYAEFGGQ